MYPADGRKVFDVYTWPFSIRSEIKQDLGEFPFPTFWGPAAGMKTPQGEPQAASRWIAESAKWIENKYHPTLSLIYLPHLDYNLQRFGPKAEIVQHSVSGVQKKGTDVGGSGESVNPAVVSDLRAIDGIVGDLICFFAGQRVQVILLSEYGITNVNLPVHLNRLFRGQGWIAIKEELGLEMLDCGASKVFAVADHQVAHVYLNERSLESKVRALMEKQEGVEAVLGASEKQKMGIDHPRSGDVIAIAKDNAWFSYYYWMDDAVAPDFARTVDIHRKPGYDPMELFLDPKIKAVKAMIAWRLLQKKLGFRMLMNVIPLDATLVKGSHGGGPSSTRDYPVLISSRPDLIGKPMMEATDVYHVIKRHF